MRSPTFTLRSYAVLANLSTSYPPLQGTFRCITHPFATRHQSSKLDHAAVRLACVRHAASVQSEPGSNSSVQSAVFRSITSGRSLSESDLNFRSNLTSVRALHYSLANGPKSVASSIKRPHLSAVCLLKNFAINFVYRVAALSAAEKRDYAELFCRCQQLVEEFLSVNSLPTPSRHPTDHQPPNRPETRTTSTSPPPHTTTVAFVSALCFAARGEL